MPYVTYRTADGYVVAITDDGPTPDDGYSTAETDAYQPGDEFTYLITILDVADGQVTSHAAVRQSPPAQEILARLAGAESEISGMKDRVAAAEAGLSNADAKTVARAVRGDE